MTKESLRRWWHITHWRLRYFLLDTDAGRRCILGVAGLAWVWALFELVVLMRTAAADAPQQAFWVQVVWFVISVLVSMALTPKQPDAADQVVEAPRLKDGAGVRMVFGEVWITDPAIIGWKKMGTKTIRGKKSGFNGRPIIGYWYKQLFHFVLCRGPVDAVLEFRGGDKTAWKGEMTATGEVQINQRELWGGQGTGGEGGIEGPLEFLFGDSAQLPSAYLASALDPKQPAYSGMLTALYKGGLWGAFSPYPKAASFKVRRILEGWEFPGGAWYPEKAEIGLTAPSSAAIYFALDLSGSMNVVTSNGQTRLQNMKAALEIVLLRLRDSVARGMPLDLMCVGFGVYPADRISITRRGCSVADVNAVISWISSRTASYGNTYFTAGVMDAIAFFAPASSMAWKGGFLITDGEPNSDPSSTLTPLQVAEEAGGIVGGLAGVPWYGINIDLADTHYTQHVHTAGGQVPVIDGGNLGELASIVSGAIYGGLVGMNPAHMLYQSITDSWMGAEPEAAISDVGFRASADMLYAEGFGLCTEWDSTTESVGDFQQRICNVIGANLSRSPVDGLWYLDLIRGGYDTSTLPVLTDDDIIEYSEQPGTMQDAVNQVIVEWRDPQRREDRSTSPVQSLGGIQAVGAVVGEVATHREIPEETLALRVGGSILQSKARPLRRIATKTTRIAHAWRPGQVIELQSAKRGIASMYCRIGDADRGTLRSGAIALTLLQDTFGLPESVYVSPDPGTDPGDDDVPKPVAASTVQEMPYALLAALQPPGELAAMPADAGFLFAVATPIGSEVDYSLQVDAGAGFDEQAESDWSATALTNASAGRAETIIGITAARGLEDAVIGAMVLWADEICRLDAVDLIAGTVTLGRGCADTVPAEHAAGSRLWVIDESIAVDATRYSDGVTISAKLLPRTSSGRLDISLAAALPVTFAKRQRRPYPPAGVKINGMWPVVGTQAGLITVEWKHRDRVLQAETLVDWTEESVGPEPGTTYIVRAIAVVGGAVLHEETGIAGTSATPFELTFTGAVRVEVVSVRDGLECWQVPAQAFAYANTNIQAFPASGTFVVPQGVQAVDVLVVAGGGGGGSRQGGGGGAGGVVVSSVAVTPGDSIAVVVGAGGAGGTAGGRGSNGGNSSFGSTTATGGGGGGGRTTNNNGNAGGSGGGGAALLVGAASAGGAGAAGEGNTGANGRTQTISGVTYPSGGGGGGAGGAAANVPVGGTGNGTNGGPGLQFPMLADYGDAGWFGGGGGGGAGAATAGGVQQAGLGGQGGGGRGASAAVGATYPDPPDAGVANTGGGGGGSAVDTIAGGAGGSGVVIVSWPAGRIPPTITAARAMTVTI